MKLNSWLNRLSGIDCLNKMRKKICYGSLAYLSLCFSLNSLYLHFILTVSSFKLFHRTSVVDHMEPLDQVWLFVRSNCFAITSRRLFKRRAHPWRDNEVFCVAFACEYIMSIEFWVNSSLWAHSKRLPKTSHQHYLCCCVTHQTTKQNPSKKKAKYRHDKPTFKHSPSNLPTKSMPIN